MLKLLLMWVGLGFEVTYLIKRFVWVCFFFSITTAVTKAVEEAALTFLCGNVLHN